MAANVVFFPFPRAAYQAEQANSGVLALQDSTSHDQRIYLFWVQASTDEFGTSYLLYDYWGTPLKTSLSIGIFTDSAGRKQIYAHSNPDRDPEEIAHGYLESDGSVRWEYLNQDHLLARSLEVIFTCPDAPFLLETPQDDARRVLDAEKTVVWDIARLLEKKLIITEENFEPQLLHGFALGENGQEIVHLYCIEPVIIQREEKTELLGYRAKVYSEQRGWCQLTKSVLTGLRYWESDHYLGFEEAALGETDLPKELVELAGKLEKIFSCEMRGE